MPVQAPWRFLAQQRAPSQCCAQGSAEPGSGPEKLLRGMHRMAQKAWHLGLRLLLEEPVSPPTMWTGGSTPGLLMHSRGPSGRWVCLLPCVFPRVCTHAHAHSHTPCLRCTLMPHTGVWCQAPTGRGSAHAVHQGRGEGAIPGRGHEAGQQLSTPPGDSRSRGHPRA